MEVTKGNKIKIHYKGTFTDGGETFDSSEGREPLEFTVGEGMVIFGFDNGVLGMKVGDKKTINIPHMEAYGQFMQEHVFEVPKEQLPQEMGEPEVGMQLQMMMDENTPIPIEIIEVKETSVVMDGNHPLAGKDLTFDLELMEIA
ncbi:MAG: peptidylprolyl isomerase [Chitinophagaceae bacterium]|nr:peptidylprolyl isomerase [Chitinophagaceae bacterium]